MFNTLTSIRAAPYYHPPSVSGTKLHGLALLFTQEITLQLDFVASRRVTSNFRIFLGQITTFRTLVSTQNG